eukprot:scaffold73910_cov37-Attheya_sp.AAC.3
MDVCNRRGWFLRFEPWFHGSSGMTRRFVAESIQSKSLVKGGNRCISSLRFERWYFHWNWAAGCRGVLPSFPPRVSHQVRNGWAPPMRLVLVFRNLVCVLQMDGCLLRYPDISTSLSHSLPATLRSG